VEGEVSLFCVCEVDGNNDLLEFGVVPALVTRRTGMRAVLRSSPPRLAEELGCRAGRLARVRPQCKRTTGGPALPLVQY
jgi:hypothetical protein